MSKRTIAKWGILGTLGLTAAYVALNLMVYVIFDWYSNAPKGAQVGNQFYINENYGSSWPLRRLSYEVVQDGVSYGSVLHLWPRLRTTFEYKDQDGGNIITANYGFAQMIGTTIWFYDEKDNVFGDVDKDVVGGVFSGWTGEKPYVIHDAAKTQLAVSQLSATGGQTTFIIRDIKSNATIAQIRRGFRRVKFLGDSWEVTVNKPGVVDPRVLVLIALSYSYSHQHEN